MELPGADFLARDNPLQSRFYCKQGTGNGFCHDRELSVTLLRNKFVVKGNGIRFGMCMISCCFIFGVFALLLGTITNHRKACDDSKECKL